jgi:vacuolar-type H+-ATPase subunit I/STV1
MAAIATLHCLTGCAIGEVLGVVIGTALNLGNPATIALTVAVGLAGAMIAERTGSDDAGQHAAVGFRR